MEVYYGEDSPKDEGEAIKLTLEAGMEYMEAYPEACDLAGRILQDRGTRLRSSYGGLHGRTSLGKRADQIRA